MKKTFFKIILLILVIIFAEKFIDGVKIAEKNYFLNLFLFALLLFIFERIFLPLLKIFPSPFPFLTFNIILLLFYMGEIFLADTLIKGVEIFDFQSLFYFSLSLFLAKKIFLKK